jgi:hypothetical protein
VPRISNKSVNPTRVVPKQNWRGPTEVTRHVRPAHQALLWGRAAGRCEFAGCNRALWKSPVTQERVNLAEKAHIYSFADLGPRGNKGIPKEKINDISNLLLVCKSCHKTIDNERDGGRYTADLLRQMKEEHERRIEIVAGIAPEKRSHVLHYGANIGNYSSPLSFRLTAPALFPNRYPADDKAIELSTINSSFHDCDAYFWAIERHALATKFSQRVSERISLGEVAHLSVFALAPTPLLIVLGTLLTDIPQADVFQLHREPQGWRWPGRVRPTPQFTVSEPRHRSGQPALVISLSADIKADRIEAVLGPEVAIWNVTIPRPNSDFVKSRNCLEAFRRFMRPLLNRIKLAHGQTTSLHVIPAMPVSIAVELGRLRMPKADMPWKVYDQNNSRGGFAAAIDIPEGTQS